MCRIITNTFKCVNITIGLLYDFQLRQKPQYRRTEFFRFDFAYAEYAEQFAFGARLFEDEFFNRFITEYDVWRNVFLFCGALPPFFYRCV